MEIFRYDSVRGFFIKRINRFIGIVYINNSTEKVYIPNTGRMKELLLKGAEVLLEYHKTSHRKTCYTLKLIKKDGYWTCVDSLITNKLFHEYILEKGINPLKKVNNVRREVPFGKSRFDIAFENQQHSFLLEVKSVNLIVNGIAMFPDAPTKRGTKHIYDLIKAKREGFQSGIIFVIQREDVYLFKPNKEMDSKFFEALKIAKENNLLIKAYKCRVDCRSISIINEVPTIIDC